MTIETANKTHSRVQMESDAIFNVSWSTYQPHGLLWAVQERYRHIFPFLILHGPGDTLIDVGCGDGSFIHTLKRLGFTINCIGLDSSDKALTRAISNTPVSYVNSIEFTNDSGVLSTRRSGIKVVTALHVLEHVEDPSAFLQNITKNCDLTLLEVPIEAGLVEMIKSRILLARNGGKHPWGHINYWMPKDFLATVSQAGLVPVYCYEYCPTLYGDSNPYQLNFSALKRFIKTFCWKWLPRILYRNVYSSFFFVAAVRMYVGEDDKRA